MEHVGPVGPDGGAAARGGEGKNWLPSKNVTTRSSTTEEAFRSARAGARSGIGQDRCHIQIKYLFHYVGTSSIFVGVLVQLFMWFTSTGKKLPPILVEEYV